MSVNDDAGGLIARSVLEAIASWLAPTGAAVGQTTRSRVSTPVFFFPRLHNITRIRTPLFHA